MGVAWDREEGVEGIGIEPRPLAALRETEEREQWIGQEAARVSGVRWAGAGGPAGRRSNRPAGGEGLP